MQYYLRMGRKTECNLFTWIYDTRNRLLAKQLCNLKRNAIAWKIAKNIAVFFLI